MIVTLADAFHDIFSYNNGGTPSSWPVIIAEHVEGMRHTLLSWLEFTKATPALSSRLKDVLLMVSFSSSFATVIFLAALYGWWANRQFHFKKRSKDGSRLSSIATPQDAVEFRARQRQRAAEAQDDSESDTDSLTTVQESQQDEDDHDYDDDDDDETIANLSDYDASESLTDGLDGDDMDDNKSQYLASLPEGKRQAFKDLTQAVSSLEVFNYLSSEAFLQCLEYMEYIDLPQNELLFEHASLDGSLYAVLEGKVQCQLEYTGGTRKDTSEDEEGGDTTASGASFVSFAASNGDVITSLLSILAGLVRTTQQRNNASFPIKIIPEGIAVRAIGIAPQSKLVRVPPQCYLALLDRHPTDVRRITQAVVTRMERVILQTVVRSLGLQQQAVKKKSLESQGLLQANADLWDGLTTRLRNYVPGGMRITIEERVEGEAAALATSSILGWQPNLDLPQTALVTEKVQQECKIVSLPPSQTLIETGEDNDSLYLVLRGALDVGMNSMGSTATALSNESARRGGGGGGEQHPRRRSIFAQNLTPGKGSFRTSKSAIRRRHVSSVSDSMVASFTSIYKAVPGDVVGRLASFTGDASIVTVRNASDWEPALVYKIPNDTYNSILTEHPTALTHCLACLLDRLRSPIISLLDWNVEWMHVQAGHDVIHRGDTCDALYAVLNGRLRTCIPAALNHSNSLSNIPTPQPGALTRNASTDSATSFLSKARKRIQDQRRARADRNKPTVARASPTPSRRRMKASGDEIPPDDFGRGAIIGEIEFLTGSDWPVDIYASRHSELARVPVNVLNAIICICPQAGIHLARVVATQIQKRNAIKNRLTQVAPVSLTPFPGDTTREPGRLAKETRLLRSPTGGQSHGMSVGTIAVVPLLSRTFDMGGFCRMLTDTLHNNIAPATLLSKDRARLELGEDVFEQRNAMHTLKLTRLCGDLEEHSLVVYQADSNYTWWTRLCIQQADCILLLVRSDEAPPNTKTEACLKWAFTSLDAKVQLVVLRDNYEDTGKFRSQTEMSIDSSDALNDWSEQRYWIAGHHLVRTPLKDHVADFQRLCRRVCGRSLGIVFGGGGARGLAHIGVVKALMEAGVTVDYVGGTSQGAYIGALFASNPDDYPSLVRAACVMADSMANTWEKLLDMTLPLVSFFSGYRFNRGIEKSLGQRRIQDLVCNFFCVSTDIRNSVQVVHTKGICWRYVRASMSLQSYLPPLSEDGTLLVDGGYVNILPADVMKRQMRASLVIAVDVSQEVILDNFEYGDNLNGWWLLWNSWNPFIKTVKIPSMGDISERLAWVNGDRQRKKVREDIDLFLQPPVANYGVLEYDKFQELVQIGYEYAKPRVENFVKKHPHLVS